MPKMKVVMVWIEGDNKWHMLREEDGRFIQEFYDCDKIHDFFWLDKEFINAFEITSRHLYIENLDNLSKIYKKSEMSKDDKSV